MTDQTGRLSVVVLTIEGSDQTVAQGIQGVREALGRMLPGIGSPATPALPAPPVAVVKDPPALLAPAPAPRKYKKRKAAAIEHKPRRAYRRREPAEEAETADAGVSELAQQVIELVKLEGPLTIGSIAVALQQSSQGIGRCVACCPLLEKNADGLVCAVE